MAKIWPNFENEPNPKRNDQVIVKYQKGAKSVGKCTSLGHTKIPGIIIGAWKF